MARLVSTPLGQPATGSSLDLNHCLGNTVRPVPSTSITSNPLLGLAEAELVDEYDRRRLGEIADHRLVELAAEIVGVPRVEVPAEHSSFVLHAPLELMARSALLPYVGESERRRARLRIASLAAAYQASGPPLISRTPRDFASLDEGVTALVGAIDEEDLDGVDTAAAWLGSRLSPDQLVAMLADHTIDRLSAAGHGNIYLQLLSRSQPHGLPQQMLRHPARQLAIRSNRRIEVPPTRVGSDPALGVRLAECLARVPVVGPSSHPGIAAMVEHTEDHGASSVLLDADRTFTAPVVRPFGLLRFAANTMLQGSPDVAAYGWTHCLTLAQAALMVAPACTDPSRAVYVATAYLAAHWATLGQGELDLDGPAPDPVGTDLEEALLSGNPRAAAAAAWHAPDRSVVVTALATSAVCAQDAHRVKYTLACLDAATADRSGTLLYLAAAAYLNAWWEQHPDAEPPVPAPALADGARRSAVAADDLAESEREPRLDSDDP